MGSRKKNAAPMWSELEDVRRVETGDILLWPGEGAVRHLHGSAATMRGLGFSVGRRWRAVSYEQMRFLADRPEETRLFAVVDTRDAARAADSNTFSTDDAPAKSQCTIVEIPLRLEAGTPSRIAARLLQYSVFTGELAAGEAIGRESGHHGHLPDDTIVDEVLEHLRQHDQPPRPYRDGFNAYLRNRCHEIPNPDDVAALLRCCESDPSNPFPPNAAETEIEVPIGVLVNARRHGAGVYRPSSELRLGIGRMLAAHALPLRVEQLRLTEKSLADYEGMIRAARARMRGCMARTKAMAKGNAAKSARPIRRLWNDLTGGADAPLDYMKGLVR